jgi:hypothetical protein
MAPPLVSDPDLVTPEWLTDVLVHAGVLGDARVVDFDAEHVGTGQVGDNVRFRLRYDGQVDAPASVVAKFASQDETSRATGIATLTYETEHAFYRDLADTVDISRPQCFFNAIEHGTAEIVLVLEDLAPAVQGDQIAGCSLEHAVLAVDEAAKLHGPRWADATLNDLPWLADRGPSSNGGAGALYVMMWSGFVDRYRATLDERALEVGTRLVAGMEAWATHEPSALTITHGDYRLDNMLFASDEGGRPLTVVDWQTVRLGCGTADVAYFLGAGLDPATRAAHEQDLVHRYHDALVGFGIDDYSFDACWEDYRRYSYSGFVMAVIASMIVGQTDRGDAMFMAMANRHAAQVIDLKADQLLS